MAIEALAAGAAGAARPAQPLARAGGVELAVWSEFVPYQALGDRLELLRAHGTALYVAVHHDKVGDPALLALLRRARAEGVEVRPWILLSEEDGYWPNARNAPQVAAQVRRYLDWTRREGVPAGWIILDMEPPLQYSRDLIADLQGRRPLRLLRTLRRGYDPVAFRAGAEAYRRLIADLHTERVQVMAVTTPLVLDDLRAGNQVYQQYAQIPVAGLPWDELSFMVYRTLYEDVVPGRVSPRLTYEYARDAGRYFPGRAGIAVGVVGTVSKTPTGGGFDRPEQVAVDVAAARAAGLNRVQVFSVDGILQMDRPEAWLRGDAAAREPRRDARTAAVRGALRVGNGVLRGLRPRR